MSTSFTERHWLELPTRYLTETSVPSPCMSVCQIDPASGWCRGCFRTLDEIADWSVLDADEKRAIWAQLPLRFDRQHSSS
ncbi:MAG TPA: DUF1289 domain-containing protein [Burkholderiaceae bacterium]|nr:DUF1289 domain-containing protein [Burkholderiaceae bacterium]